MPSPVTFAFYALLVTGDGQDVEKEWLPGLTIDECFSELSSRQPSAVVTDSGEAEQTVYGCEQEPLNDPDSTRSVRAMFEAAQREDWR